MERQREKGDGEGGLIIYLIVNSTFYMFYSPTIISSLGIPDYKSNLITVY